MASVKLPASTRAHTGDRSIDAAQQLAQQTARKYNGNPFLDGKLVENCSITTAGAVITHGLGRKPKGYIITRLQQNASAVVEALPAQQPPDLTKQIKLIAATATVVADLWFF